jgi:acyl-coenzyme A synthetase/AMP-(fatty) acid ligase
MVPKDIRIIETMPLNPNGKIDRKVLAATLEQD